MTSRHRRVQAALAAQFTRLVAVGVVLILLGAGLTYTAVTAERTTTEQRPGPTATYTGEFTHHATVEQPNPVFPVGRTLSNRSVYFTRLAPTLNGTFTYRYTAAETGNLSVDATLVLVFESVEARSDGSTIDYWEERRRLDQETRPLAPGESIRLTFARNITRLATESRRLDRAVGPTPGRLRSRLVATVNATGTVNGRSVARTGQYSLGVSSDDGIYRVTDPGSVTNTTNQSRRVTVSQSPGRLRMFGGIALGLMGLAGLAGLGIGRHRDLIGLDETAQAFLEYQAERDEFDDWITRAELPADVFAGPVVAVGSLAGLVDIAIDSDRRVIQNDDDEFVVVGDDLVYRYTPPPKPAQADDALSKSDG